MTTVVRASVLVYERLLILYPRELRQRFGTEMVRVFEEALRDAARWGRTRGIVALWRTALWELVSVGMPQKLQSPAAIAGALSVFISSLIAWVFFRAFG